MKTPISIMLTMSILAGCVSNEEKSVSTKQPKTLNTLNFKGDERFAGFWECVNLNKNFGKKDRYVGVKWQQVYDPKTSKYYSFDVLMWNFGTRFVINRETSGKLEITDKKIIDHRFKAVAEIHPRNKKLLAKRDKKSEFYQWAMEKAKKLTTNKYLTLEESIVSWTKNKLVTTYGSESDTTCTRITGDKVFPDLRAIKF